MSEPDSSVERVREWFSSRDEAVTRFGRAIRQSFDEVYDGQRTGRYSIDQLAKVEKTYIGTKVELLVQNEFALARGSTLDYVVDGIEVDAKWSMAEGGWMIPLEAVGQICLCMTASDGDSLFSVGLVRADDEILGAPNRDKKRSLTSAGRDEIAWIGYRATLPENILMHLGSDDRDAVLDAAKSGQQRVNELFRRVRGRIIDRNTVLTVARQDDGPKRVRDARLHLQREGILILGHQNDHPRIARACGLPVPAKGTWVSVRVIPSGPTAERAFEIDGSWWESVPPGDSN